jgi:ADP-ribosyl-[dinitrogen reductase] hydrolase
VDACVAYAEVLADAIEGQRRSEVLRGGRISPERRPARGAIGPILAGSWRARPGGSPRVRVRGPLAGGLALERGRSGDFRSAVLRAANLGEDADTTAAITGQLAGRSTGLSGIPEEWRGKVAWGPRIIGMAEGLVDAAH